MIFYSVLIITVIHGIFGGTISVKNQQECIVPNFPTNGHLSIVGSNSPPNPGDKVPPGTVIVTRCNDQYKLEGKSLSVCFNGQWNENIGQCLILLCPPISATPAMTVKCTTSDGKTVDNCHNATNGTAATLECAPFYENSELKPDPSQLCVNGKWNKELPNCRPICGIKPEQATTSVANELKVRKSDYPWHVALYSIHNTTKSLICGGSMLSPRVILTAAHCVTDIKGELRAKELFLVAVGKYHSNFDDPRDTMAQFSLVHEIFVPRQYRGEVQNYFGDIAMIVTVDSFSISKYVQPICIDWDGKYQSQFLTESSTGFLTGWSYTAEDGTLSDSLRDVEIPYVEEQICREKLPLDYQSYLTSDKICSGFSNKSVAVCRGDGGGGLVFKNRENGRYYITGIASVSSLSDSPAGGCDSRFALYTRVSDYISSFILSKVNLYWT